jgi:hypothetical protein
MTEARVVWIVLGQNELRAGWRMTERVNDNVRQEWPVHKACKGGASLESSTLGLLPRDLTLISTTLLRHFYVDHHFNPVGSIPPTRGSGYFPISIPIAGAVPPSP